MQLTATTKGTCSGIAFTFFKFLSAPLPFSPSYKLVVLGMLVVYFHPSTCLWYTFIQARAFMSQYESIKDLAHKKEPVAACVTGRCNPYCAPSCYPDFMQVLAITCDTVRVSKI